MSDDKIATILTKIEIVISDINRIRKNKGQITEIDFDDECMCLIQDLDDCSKLAREEQKRKSDELYKNSAAAKQSYSLLHPPKKMKIIHEVDANLLPQVVTGEAMKSTLTLLSEDEDLGPLKYISYFKMNNGTICFNIQGICPIHRREHDGGAKLWQIQQSPESNKDGFVKCWLDGGFKRFNRFPLY